jgi:hypothetical protein
MPFGLMNAMATFQTMMNDVLKPFLLRFVLLFFNDILIYNPSWYEHLHQLRLMLAKLQEQKLFIKKSMCAFDEGSVAYLGHVISDFGVAMDDHKVSAVLEWLIPHTMRTVWGFLGLAGYYYRFIQDYGTITRPLTMLLCDEGFRWNQEVEFAFWALQHALMFVLVLQLLDFSWDFTVECNASSSGVSAVLH